jgi:hypothetical protein
MIEMAKAIRLGGLTIQYQTDEALRPWIEVGFQIHILIHISYLELPIRKISYQNQFIICNYKSLSIIDTSCHNPQPLTTSESNSPWCCEAGGATRV